MAKEIELFERLKRHQFNQMENFSLEYQEAGSAEKPPSHIYGSTTSDPRSEKVDEIHKVQ